MKQLLQNMRDGKAVVAEVPAPAVRRGCALVQTAASLVSAGTERMVVEFAEKSLLGKARSRPDLVRQILDKARREGLLPTLQAAFNRLDQPMALGYASAGTVIAVGEGLRGFQPGDRVACAGGGFAVHAEVAIVPQNLLAKLPDTVDFEQAAFTTLAAIALHGFRLAQPQVGERVAVIGLGLLGLLSVGLARAAGCSVFGVDLSPQRVALARQLGAEAVLRADAEAAGAGFTRGRGFDTVLICADARSNDPIELAGALARDRGHVIAVGAVGLNIPRKVYYEKEIQFLVSRSYGPGRYDPAYEERGQDYPLGFVRWTEGRNLEAVVDLLESGRLDVRPLITHRFPIERGAEAYELITGKRNEPFLGVLLTYPQDLNAQPQQRIALTPRAPQPLTGQPVLGVLGAGNYATAMFLPAVKKTGGVALAGVVSAGGLSARHAAQKFGFNFASSDEAEILDNPDVNLVALLTRHNQHARQSLRALRNGKHVYCEKPLAINEAELSELTAALQDPQLPLLTVGFNRRFAPLAQTLKSTLVGRTEPLAAHYRVNAGYLPLTHWTQDPAVGGGRIIGEGCHFIDFLVFLVGQLPVRVEAQALPDGGRYRQDNVQITLTFPDGSLGTLTYLSNGDKSVAKERMEVFCGGT
ncbi:MAG: bi-domain-containing oxidoreductase, partial [Anaerolineae bacterium]|nr:bi-domain-containing oxidoreductase [Anaerolineae bacterium]